MDTVLLIAMVFNVLLTAVLVVLVIKRTGRRATSSDAGDLSTYRSDLRAQGLELRQDLSGQRTELQTSIAEGHKQLETRMQVSADSLAAQLDRDRQSRESANDELKRSLNTSIADLNQKFHDHVQGTQTAQTQLKAAIEARFDELRAANDVKLEKVRETVEKLQASNADALKGNADRILILTESNAVKQQELQTLLREELDTLRKGNEAKLEKMRETVDEKLQGTLEKRLGESFALVSDRLEQVQKGLGEMQSLASDVGGLKRVLTNVKSRGTWGEVQLSRQLEDMLSPEQFDRNVVVKPGTRESVEFAIKMPGREDDSSVYLPIDSKLPQEDYERLLTAQESGEKVDVDAASKLLERAILLQAKSIADKYISPPETTDFAIMYLPTEGLFAEVIRLPGLASKLQNDHRVLITGPTTLMSLLNSLQMGFRTLAIEKRSSEVWQVLSSAKTEFQKYGQVWTKLEKQLQTAQNTVHEAGRRTRAVERNLRSVETSAVDPLPAVGVNPLEPEELEEIVAAETISDSMDSSA
jgi:DNA recombination protein RmuC